MGRVKAMVMDREERAYDRGSADAYYGRIPLPNLWLDPMGMTVVKKDRMTKSEIGAYYDGYSQQDVRKDWGCDEKDVDTQ